MSYTSLIFFFVSVLSIPCSLTCVNISNKNLSICGCTIDVSLSSKSVRLDIFIEDDRNTIYNVEILPLGDETTKIILNTKGTAIDVSDDMKALLNYIDGQLPSDAYTTELR